MLPITKNQNRKTHRKVFNLALLALILIIWSCSTTETTGSSSRVDTIELYESQVPLLYTGLKADGTPNTNLLLSGFVKYPADGRLLNFEVADNEYGITADTTSSDFFQYSMLEVTNWNVTNGADININVAITPKDNPAISNNLTLILNHDIRRGITLSFAGLNRRVFSGGCEVKIGAVAGGGDSAFGFNWFARFKPGDGVYNGSTNINLAFTGLDPESNIGVDTTSKNTINIFSGSYTIENSPNPLLAKQYPWYSLLTFTIPPPNDPAFADTSNPTNANIRNGIAMTFLGSNSNAQTRTDNFIDYQCNAS